MIRYLLIFYLLCPVPAFAIDAPHQILSDTKLESQAQDMFDQILCPVCEGQTLSSSNAELAISMRALIRERLKSGQTPEEIMLYLKARYGDEIDVSADFNASNALLWLLPFAVFLLGFGFMGGMFINKQQIKKRDAVEAKKKANKS